MQRVRGREVTGYEVRQCYLCHIARPIQYGCAVQVKQKGSKHVTRQPAYPRHQSSQLSVTTVVISQEEHTILLSSLDELGTHHSMPACQKLVRYHQLLAAIDSYANT